MHGRCWVVIYQGVCDLVVSLVGKLVAGFKPVKFYTNKLTVNVYHSLVDFRIFSLVQGLANLTVIQRHGIERRIVFITRYEQKLLLVGRYRS